VDPPNEVIGLQLTRKLQAGLKGILAENFISCELSYKHVTWRPPISSSISRPQSHPYVKMAYSTSVFALLHNSLHMSL
jgi:hypothetical protein